MALVIIPKLFLKKSKGNIVKASVCLSATLLGCLVCVICNSKSFHYFILKFWLMVVHTLKMCTFYFVHIS